MTQLALFDVKPKTPQWPYCIHGVLITFTPKECAKCDAGQREP